MQRRSIITATCAILILALAGAAHAKPAIAVLGLEVVEAGGIDEETTRVSNDLTRALRERAALGKGPYELAPNSKKDLLEMKLLSDCANETRACMANIGRELDARRLLYGKIEKRKNGYQVSLKLLNVENATMEKSTSELIPFDDAGTGGLAEWGNTLYERLTGMPQQGTLVVKTNVDQGTVYIDGEIKGSLSAGAARIAGLSDGEHSIAIDAPDHERYAGKVTVSAGGTEEVLVDLTPSTGAVGDGGGDRPGGVSRVLFWTSLVATGASATGMTITGLQVRGELQDEKMAAMQAVAESGGPRFVGDDACDQADAYDGPADISAVLDACQDGRDRAMLSNAFLGATIVGALASTYFYYKGYVAPGSASNKEKLTRGDDDGTTVTVTPTISPDQLGAGVTIEF